MREKAGHAECLLCVFGHEQWGMDRSRHVGLHALANGSQQEQQWCPSRNGHFQQGDGSDVRSRSRLVHDRRP